MPLLLISTQTIVGGIKEIIENLKVNNLIIGKQIEETEECKEILNLATKKNINVKLVKQGQRINIDKNLYFNILWPNDNYLISENGINNNSIVGKLVYKNSAILFTGDVEEEAEKEILKLYKNNIEILNSDILKVAHHGSKTSSSVEFLNAVKPKIALIGVGENNKYGHPNKIVLQNLKNIYCQIYRTDETGEIQIKIDKRGKIYLKNFVKTDKL